MKRYSVCVKGSGNSRSRNAHRCVHSSKCIGGDRTTSSACSLSAINSLPWSPDEEKVIVRNASVTIRCISKRKNDTNERYTIIEDIENWGKHKILTVRACLTILLQLCCGIHSMEISHFCWTARLNYVESQLDIYVPYPADINSSCWLTYHAHTQSQR